jgi:hypothetical protein
MPPSGDIIFLWETIVISHSYKVDNCIINDARILIVNI